MRTRLILTLGVMLLAARSCDGAVPTGGFTYGNNIWGNTLGLRLDVPLSERWFVEFDYGKGYVNFTTTDWGDFLYLEGLPGEEHRVSLDMKQLVDIGLSYHRNRVSGLHLFNEFGAGLTHVYVRLRSEFEKEDYPGTYRAEKDYSRYGFFLTTNVVDFEPGSFSDMVFSLGVRSKLIWMDSPQELNYTNGFGGHELSWDKARHGNTLYYPYPELFLAARYRF